MENRVEKLFRKAETETSEIYGPLGNLCGAIVTAAWSSYKGFCELLKSPVEGQPSEKQMLVFYEYVYFFTHLTLRTLVECGLNEDQISKLQNFIGPLLSRTAVDTFFRHWPLERKLRIADEFFDKLNDAEADYAECRGLMLPNSTFERESLMGRLSQNVAECWEDPLNPLVIIAAKHSAVKAFTQMSLAELVRHVAAVIDSVEPEVLATLKNRPWT